MQVVVRELDTQQQRSSTATLTINVLDLNDNAPSVPSVLLLQSVPEGNYEGGTGRFLVSVSGEMLKQFLH